MNRARLVYNGALVLLSPAFFVYYLHRIFISGKSRKAWRQQLGDVTTVPPRQSGKPRIWIQAVSVGEVVTSAPILAALKELLPDSELILSTTTITGRKVAEKSASNADYIIYFPLDFIPCVSLALDRVRPDVFVSVESEIWPNFLEVAHSRGVRTAIVNGIVSDKTMRRSKNLKWLYRWALSRVDRVCVQSEQDAERIINLGACNDCVSIEGNCKFDEPVPEKSEDERAELRNTLRIPPDVPVFVAGSTNPGEDEPVIEAFAIARRKHPQMRMILAPRQIERASEIAEMLSSKGFSSGRRSELEKLTGKEDVIILDTLGELAAFYSIAQAAFVGGNLIKKGGHNILQPIAHGKPVYFGPYTFKCRDLVRMAVEAGVGFEISDGTELGESLANMIDDHKWLKQLEEKAMRLMTSNRGASARCAEVIASLAAEKAN